MPVAEIGDPRLQALFGASDPREAGVRPTVRLPRKGLPPFVLVIAAIVLGVLLFTVLNARRTTQAEPSVRTSAITPGVVGWAAPPPLYVPPVQEPVIAPGALAEQQSAPRLLAVPVVAPAPRPAAPQIVYAPQPIPQMIAAPSAPPTRVSTGAPLVIDTGAGPAGAANTRAQALPLMPSGQTTTRMRASAFANRGTTIAQGTLIPAVLETGFDSTQPGFARAMVSRDVRSFDGSKVLIPRGSKLIGEYRSDVAQGQKRAVIIWTRLIRPDGMTIALDSPAVDTLGRGGVPASVNTHFLARVGDALLQSTVGLGSALAQRAVTGPVIVLPGAAGAVAGQMTPAASYVPTLTVPAGKSISIFVAHDLDFTAAGPRE